MILEAVFSSASYFCFSYNFCILWAQTMNLFQSYLVKYAYGGCDAMGSLNPSDLLQERLESILSDLDKPELEHAAPVADKVVEITVVKTSADPKTTSKLTKSLINYGLKVAPKLMPMFDPKELADVEIDMDMPDYLGNAENSAPKPIKKDSPEFLNDDKAPYHTSTSELFKSKVNDTALA